MVLKTYAGECPYRIGSYLYTDEKNFNPNIIYSGTTWERVKGKVLAGVDEGDTDTNVKTSFNQSAGKALGHKKTQAHTHHMMVDRTTGNPQIYFPAWQCSVAYKEQISSPATRFGVATKSTGDGDAENIQPTRLTYIWVRTK